MPKDLTVKSEPTRRSPAAHRCIRCLLFPPLENLRTKWQIVQFLAALFCRFLCLPVGMCPHVCVIAWDRSLTPRLLFCPGYFCSLETDKQSISDRVHARSHLGFRCLVRELCREVSRASISLHCAYVSDTYCITAPFAAPACTPLGHRISVRLNNCEGLSFVYIYLHTGGSWFAQWLHSQFVELWSAWM